MALEFAASEPLTLGVEVELQLLDPASFDLVAKADDVFAALGGTTDRIKPELFLSMLEVCTGICTGVADVRRDLTESYDRLERACSDVGVRLAATGSHPFARYADRLIYPHERYQYLLDRNQWITRRLMIFGVHVHIGMRNGDHAMAMANGLVRWLPHLLALSASSPYWQGQDTGLASARSTVFESLPTAGHPNLFATWGEFEAFYDALIDSHSIGSMKDLWSDIRPSPGYGTLEVRICDGFATLEETLAMVALLQCLAHAIDQRWMDGEAYHPMPAWIVRENKWRAARWGLQADLVLDEAGRSRSLRADLDKAFVWLEPHARALACSAELAIVAQMAAAAGSHERQRKVAGAAGSLTAVAAQAADEFAARVLPA